MMWGEDFLTAFVESGYHILPSKALSASKALKLIASMSGATPAVSKRRPSSYSNQSRLTKASVRARILIVSHLFLSDEWPGCEPHSRPLRVSGT